MVLSNVLLLFIFLQFFKKCKFSLVAETVEKPPAMQETQVSSLGWEDLLEMRTATHSSILAQRIPRTEEPGRL